MEALFFYSLFKGGREALGFYDVDYFINSAFYDNSAEPTRTWNLWGKSSRPSNLSTITLLG